MKKRERIILREHKKGCAMKCLAGMAVFTALISGVSLTNAQADGTSIYIAGKGKYCKEAAVSGYLDCFYASLDACQTRPAAIGFGCDRSSTGSSIENSRNYKEKLMHTSSAWPVSVFIA